MSFNFKMLAAVMVLLCSAAVQAEGAYMGGVIGVMDTDGSDDDPFNAGIRAGYTWSSGWGIEAELTGSMTDGDI